MTDPTPRLSADSASFVEAWSESLTQVLGQISGSALACAVLAEAPAELPPASEGDLWMVCPLTGGVRGEMSFRIAPASAVRLARIFMGEPPDAAPEVSSEQREAVTELLRQVAGLVASALKPHWGEVQLRPDAAPGPPSWPASSTTWLRAGEDPASAALVEAHLSAALVAALRAEKTEAAEAASTIEVTALAPPSPEESRVKLDLLLDVELALVLRFGSRSLPLRDILDLKPGAVIDLDRQVQEPVDVLLDGRLVARGEVVVMEGNYGLRVTEVAPRPST